MTTSVLRQLVEQGYDPVLTMTQVEALTGLKQRTLRRLADDNQIAIIRLSSRRCGVRRSEVERFLASRETADVSRDAQPKPYSRNPRKSAKEAA